VFWADIVRGRQQEYLLYAATRSKLRTTDLHKLVIEGLGDAAAYQKTKERENSAYYGIQERLRRTIKDASMGPNDARPLVLIGHSLGCHIISSYAWDLHKAKAASNTPKNRIGYPIDREMQKAIQQVSSASPFERLDTFAGFVTMGSNMPLFTFTFGPQYVYPITKPHREDVPPAFPGPKLSSAVRDRARWLNYFSRNDPLGYPLKPLNDAYDDESRLDDIHTCSEGLRWCWLRLMCGPIRQLAAGAAHIGYWTNRKVARGTAGLLRNIILAEEQAKAEQQERASCADNRTIAKSVGEAGTVPE
jgi:hypothetical protein